MGKEVFRGKNMMSTSSHLQTAYVLSDISERGGPKYETVTG